MPEDNRDINSRPDNGGPQYSDAPPVFEGQSANAYTQPADASDSTPFFSATNGFAPPAFPPHTYNGEPQKSRPAAARIAAFVLGAFALIALTTAVVWFFINFDVSFISGDGSVSFSVSPRGVQQETAGDPGLYVPPFEENDDRGEAAAQDKGKQYTGSGKTLEVLPTPSNTRSGAEGDELSYQEIYEKCAPSVVAVTTVIDGGTSYGTGIIMDNEGYIITNHHVVAGAVSLSVKLLDGKEYDAVLVGGDQQTDLAILKIDAAGLTAAEFGDSDSVSVGDRVLAIGNPLAQDFSLTDGIVSAINRNISYGGYSMTLLQTNAALNEGNSGGPLINMYGQVIGITNMKLISSYSTIEGIGFAIPISSVKSVIDELLEKGYISGRPAIGITVEDLTSSVSAYYSLPSGVYVVYVDEKSDAYAKGIRPGDVIVAINDVEISSAEELSAVKNEFAVGDTVTLSVYRSGQTSEIEITLIDAADVS